MGFYLRKSIKLGGFRINLSKSGVGYSVGTKGFRISTNSKGTYLNAGRNGFYYRERLDKPKSKVQKNEPIFEVSENENGTIKTADVSQLVDSSNDQILAEINQRKNKVAMMPFIIALFIYGIFSITKISPAFGLTFLIGGIVMILFTYKWDKNRRTTELFYDLENSNELTRFLEIQKICKQLATTQKIWKIDTKQYTADWKRNAGSSSLISRKPIKIKSTEAPFIKTNVDIWTIDLQTIKLYFFPDNLLVLQNGRYGAVSYNSLRSNVHDTRFVEDSFVPSDSKIVDYTWKYVNKNGSPDKRFSNNKQFPVALYATIELLSNSGLNIHLQTSNVQIGNSFSNFFNRLS